MTKPYKEHLRETLKTAEDYRGYLDACHKEGPDTFALAVKDVLDLTATNTRVNVEAAVWIATRDFKGILNELQRRAIALATVEALQTPASTTKAEG